jgi:histidine ammonia-lyase
MNRPQIWLNWEAARVLDMVKGSYLLDEDPSRILQDPESLRASGIRQGSAWKAWGTLRDDVLLQINSSDHNPAVLVGLSPDDSPELNSPYMRTLYVKGGKYSNGQHGFIVSNANWDPYPLANDLEAFTIALANMDAAVSQRMQRFDSDFVTGVKPAAILPPEQLARVSRGVQDSAPDTLLHVIAGLAVPVAPSENAGDSGIADLQSESRIKASRVADAVDRTMDLLGLDLLKASFWMELRRIQVPSRRFGAAPEAVLAALRKRVPFLPADTPPVRPTTVIAAGFIKATDPAQFYAGANPPPPQGFGVAGVR